MTAPADEKPRASASCFYCSFVGEGSTLGGARLDRDRHIAFNCPDAPAREQAKAEKRIHWI